MLGSRRSKVPKELANVADAQSDAEIQTKLRDLGYSR